VLPSASLAEVDVKLSCRSVASGNVATGLSHSGVAIDESSDPPYPASGRPLDLTFKEFELLRYLVANPGRVFTREQLLQTCGVTTTLGEHEQWMFMFADSASNSETVNR